MTLSAGQVCFPTAAKAAHSDVRNIAWICCGSMSSHSTSAQKQSPNTTFGRSHPPHVTWRVYATISDFANVFAKLPSQAYREVELAEVGKIPLAVSAPVFVRQFLAVLDAFLPVSMICLISLITCEKFYTFAPQSRAFLSQLSVTGDESGFFMSCRLVRPWK